MVHFVVIAMLMTVVLCTRTAMEKMKTIYEQNPSLGDAQQVAQRLAESSEKIETLKLEIEEFKVHVLYSTKSRSCFIYHYSGHNCTSSY